MTNRTRIYRALREAGPDGLTHKRLREIVGAPCAPHIESLRHEGIEIEDVLIWRNKRGYDRGWRIERDRLASDLSRDDAGPRREACLQDLERVGADAEFGGG